MDVSNELPVEMSTLLDNLKKNIFSTFNCVQIGKINSIDRSAGTVSIIIQIKREAADGTSTSIPMLTDCPYFVLQGGGAYIDMPITAGDYCIVLFNDRDIDNWWKTANVTTPASIRKHSLSDGIALVGISPTTKVLSSSGSLVRILGTSGAGNELEAARKTDEIQSTSSEDSTYWAFFTALNTFLTTWASACSALVSSEGSPAGVVAYATTMGTAISTLGSAPSSLTGKITGGSSEVKIG